MKKKKKKEKLWESKKDGEANVKDWSWTFNIGSQIDMVTVRTKINLLHGFVDHPFLPEQPH